jgi:hypothetical protein
MEINGQQIRSMVEKGKEIREKLSSFYIFLDKYTKLDSKSLEAIKTIIITEEYRQAAEWLCEKASNSISSTKISSQQVEELISIGAKFLNYLTPLLWFLEKFIKLPDENLNAIEKLEVPNEHREIAKWLLSKQKTQDS